jgi:hypothetical protein
MGHESAFQQGPRSEPIHIHADLIKSLAILEVAGEKNKEL